MRDAERELVKVRLGKERRLEAMMKVGGRIEEQGGSGTSRCGAVVSRKVDLQQSDDYEKDRVDGLEDDVRMGAA